MNKKQLKRMVEELAERVEALEGGAVIDDVTTESLKIEFPKSKDWGPFKVYGPITSWKVEKVKTAPCGVDLDKAVCWWLDADGERVEVGFGEIDDKAKWVAVDAPYNATEPTRYVWWYSKKPILGVVEGANEWAMDSQFCDQGPVLNCLIPPATSLIELPSNWLDYRRRLLNKFGNVEIWRVGDVVEVWQGGEMVKQKNLTAVGFTAAALVIDETGWVKVIGEYGYHFKEWGTPRVSLGYINPISAADALASLTSLE